MKTPKTVIQTAGLIESFQNWTMVAAAVISVGAEIAIVYPMPTSVPSAMGHFRDIQKFQPVAAPSAGSTNLVAWRTKPPLHGMKDEISPVVYEIPPVTKPMTMYAKKAPAGPAMAMTWPELKNRPVPCEVQHVDPRRSSQNLQSCLRWQSC